MKTNKGKFTQGNDGVVDISSGVPAETGGSRYSKDPGKKKTKLVIIIVSISVLVAAALGVAGFCLFNNINETN